MKKTIKGYLFHRIEKLGNKKYSHIGFEDKQNNFGNMIESLVPKEGMKRKAKLTIEMIDEK